MKPPQEVIGAGPEWLFMAADETRALYEEAIQTLSQLKAENQISLDGLRDLSRAREKLLALTG